MEAKRETPAPHANARQHTRHVIPAAHRQRIDPSGCGVEYACILARAGEQLLHFVPAVRTDV